LNSFSKITEKEKNYQDTYFHGKSYVSMYWATFWAILPQTHLVTLAGMEIARPASSETIISGRSYEK
jgi:hypothetical protein